MCRERKGSKANIYPHCRGCLGFEHFVQSLDTKTVPELVISLACQSKPKQATPRECKHKSHLRNLTPQVVFDLGFLHACDFFLLLLEMKTDTMLRVSLQRIINPVDACRQGWEKLSHLTLSEIQHTHTHTDMDSLSSHV